METLAPIDTRKEEINKLRDKIAKIEANKVLKIGLLGVPNAGKTALLIAWYLFRADERYQINIKFPHEPTAYYLKQATDALLESGKTQATGHMQPEQLTFFIRHKSDKEWYEVQTLDYSGRLAGAINEKAIRPMVDEFRGFLDECDGVLCLTDSTRPHYHLLNSIDLSLKSKPKYLIYLLTKFDELGGYPADRSEFQESYDDLKQRHPLIGDLYNQILANTSPENFKMVPVAALGNIFDNGQLKKIPPLNRDDIKPWNIYLPLHHILKKKKETIAQEIDVLRMRIQKVESEIGDMEKVETTRKYKEQVEKEKTIEKDKERKRKEIAEKQTQRQDEEEQSNERLEEIRQKIRANIENFHYLRFVLQAGSWLYEVNQIKDDHRASNNTRIAKAADELIDHIKETRRTYWTMGAILFIAVLILAPSLVFLLKYLLS